MRKPIVSRVTPIPATNKFREDAPPSPQPEEEDPLAPARGCFNALLFDILAIAIVIGGLALYGRFVAG